jgi:iron complex transport system ATP-binding protein
MLEIKDVNAGYDEKLVVQNFSYTFEEGKFYGILGPNGSGKSTLLNVMSGVMKATVGEVLLNGKAITSYPSKQLAQQMAVLTQFHHTAFTNTVRETVSVGRYPFQSSFFSSWSEQDERAVINAMAQTGIIKYEHENMEYLSGGEQQRVFIAQALAQQANILLLDEPTNHLDIAYQKQTLDLIHQKVKADKLTVIGIFHDINLASLYCDELILMNDGSIEVAGSPHEVVQKESVEKVYEAEVLTYAHPKQAKPQITLIPTVQQNEPYKLTVQNVKRFAQHVELSTPMPLKTISSAVYHAGLGWYTTFINRTVAQTYNVQSVEQEVEQFLSANQYPLANCVVMLTAVPTECAVVQQYEHEGASIIVLVTAGTKHAIDVSKAIQRERSSSIGTINTFVFINGELSEEAFYQAMMTATEAKAKALFDEQIVDSQFGSPATGTGTDSLLISATQHGEIHRYAGPLTKLGQLIGHGVYDATKQAIRHYNKHITREV